MSSPMEPTSQKWVLEVLESWLTTWDDLEDEDPVELREVIDALRVPGVNLTKEAYNEILFHLYQKFSDPEDG